MSKKNTTILQSNVLTESRYNFSRIEKNCLYKIIEKVRQEYIENPNTKSVEEFQDMVVHLPPSVLEDIADKAHRKQAHDALVGFRKRDVEITWEDGSWLNTGFINWCKYSAGSDMYQVSVSGAIMPYLVELARQYTAYSLTIAIALKSVYSQRFYELCCQYRNNVEKDGFPGFHKTQDQLRDMFFLEDKYKDNQDFNRNVIKRAEEELKAMYDKGQCDLYFAVNIKGRGKSMCYDFKIHTREQSEAQKQAFEDVRVKWLYIQQELLAVYKRDTKFVQRTMKALDFNPNLVDPVFAKIKKARESLSGADLAKLLRFILKEDFDLK